MKQSVFLIALTDALKVKKKGKPSKKLDLPVLVDGIYSECLLTG
jgi:hypothetical protein